MFCHLAKTNKQRRSTELRLVSFTLAVASALSFQLEAGAEKMLEIHQPARALILESVTLMTLAGQ